MAPSSVQQDETLIRQCQAGSDEAFDRLVEQTKNAAYTVAYRYTHDTHLALDMVQEAYIKLYKFLPKWDFSCRVQTWLYRVVTNLCIDHHRRSKKHLVLMEDWSDQAVDSIAGAEAAPGHDLRKQEWRAEIEVAITALPDRMQAAFRMKYIAGLSLKEIAEIQQCSVGTVKASIFQAANKLRQQFSREEILR